MSDFISWRKKTKRLCWLINKPVHALKVLRYRHCSVSRYGGCDNKMGSVCFQHHQGWIGNDVMGFCTVIFPLECERLEWGFWFWMFRCFWEALLTFYGVVIGNGKKKWHYIYIIYINIYYTYSPILYFSYHPHRSWQELLRLKGFWVLIKTLFMTVFIISLKRIL